MTRVGVHKAVSSAAAVSFIALLSSPAVGQTTSPPNENTGQYVIEDIIVTAQRRAERLQDVPIAITALNGVALERKGVSNLFNLAGTIPSLSITTFAGTNSTNLVTLRGIAGQPLPIGASQATAVYLDGVYLSRPDAGFFTLDDIQRIEVLRGPQGTLYGRNATAGAINIVTRTPGDALYASIDASYGNYDEYVVRGSVGAPLGGGLSVGFSGSLSGHDGFYINTVTGNRIGDKSSETGRIKLHYDKDSGFDATLSADYTSTKSVDLYKPTMAGPNGVEFTNPKFVETDVEDDLGTHVKTGGVALVVNVDISSSVVMTSITSLRKFRSSSLYDLDATVATAFHSLYRNENDTFNQEIRAVHTGDVFRATVGGNYYHERGEYYLRVNPLVYSQDWLQEFATPRDTTSLNAMAVFGQFEYDLMDNLTAVGGLRFNYERRDFTIDYSNAGNFPLIQGDLSDKAVLPSIGLNFRALPDVLLYGKISKGYQAPGFNFLPGAGAPQNTFDAETLWAYEAGVKSQFFDRRVTFNAAAFYYDYKDVQVRSLVAPTVAQVLNAASARVKGVELELIVLPVEGLTLNGQVTYAKAVYSEFCEGISAGTPANGAPLCVGTAVPSANRKGFSLTQAPRWTGGFGANYNRRVANDLTLNLSADFAWESNVYYTSINETAVSSGGWHRINARVGLEHENGVEVYVYGNNLTDERYAGYAGRLGTTMTTLNDPRTYGVGARYRF